MKRESPFSNSMQQEVFDALVESEKLADEILAEKNQSLLLGIQKNENRECLNGLKGLKENKLLWVSTGTIFLQKPKAEVIKMIEKDQAILDQETKDLTQSIKNKTYRLKQIEGKSEEVSGFFLNPLPKNETGFLEQL